MTDILEEAAGVCRRQIARLETALDALDLQGLGHAVIVVPKDTMCETTNLDLKYTKITYDGGSKPVYIAPEPVFQRLSAELAGQVGMLTQIEREQHRRLVHE